MYCKRCGKKINDESRFCPFCGEFVEGDLTPASACVPSGCDGGQDASAWTGYLFLGICFPTVGFILFFLWRKSARARARKLLTGAVIGAAIGIVLLLPFISLPG